jgi:2-keto-4-pentenoate hydratase/2-oxohepta-3-ene-1,7-dioic acid hydratase in catechol pathway
VQKKFANKYYDQIGLGIDFTARDLQKYCKEQGHPWEKAKGFDGSAVLGKKFIHKEEFEDLNNIEFHLNKNGELAQSGNTRDMLFQFDLIIEYISKYFTLKIGDLIFTGTPSGVGPVAINDKLEGYLQGEKILDVNIK